MCRQSPWLPTVQVCWRTYWHWIWIACWTHMALRWPYCRIWSRNGSSASSFPTSISGQSTRAFRPCCRSVFWCHCCWRCCHCHSPYWNIPQHLRPSCLWHCRKSLCGVHRLTSSKPSSMGISMRRISPPISGCRHWLRTSGNAWMCHVCCAPSGQFGKWWSNPPDFPRPFLIDFIFTGSLSSCWRSSLRQKIRFRICRPFNICSWADARLWRLCSGWPVSFRSSATTSARCSNGFCCRKTTTKTSRSERCQQFSSTFWPCKRDSRHCRQTNGSFGCVVTSACW